MVTSQFGAILKDLESFFKCPLEPDLEHGNACLVQIPSGLKIQIELNRSNNLVIGVKLGVIPHSRYRENVFREALKANNSSSPVFGVFSYGNKSGQLILFTIIDNRSINPDKIQAILTPFIEKAQGWFDAITRGEVPQVITETSASRPNNLFGLMH